MFLGLNIKCFLIFFLCANAVGENSSKLEDDSAFSFALIGDVPYGAQPKIDFPPFDNLVSSINADNNVDWVLHAGDIKSGGTSCSDMMLEDRLNRFRKFNKPFVLTPGDNEWTDCHRVGAGMHSPLERLEKIRTLFYSKTSSLIDSEQLKVVSQSSRKMFSNYVENVIWYKNKVTFATIHASGSKNGLADFDKNSSIKRSLEDDSAVKERINSAIAWLNYIFEESKDSAGIFIMIHANPGFEKNKRPKGEGYIDFITSLEEHVKNFKKPVVLAHGDSHYFRIDKPYFTSGSSYYNFTRIETFAAPDYHWIKVNVLPDSRSVFYFDTVEVSTNK